MRIKERREQELYSSGMVDFIKCLFEDKNVNISEDYYVLIADYIDSLDEVKDSLILDTFEIANRLPELVSNIQDANLGGIYGITNENGITINQSLSYEDRKLYFFHELTHALQTSNINGVEHCGFYNGHDGMFLTEASTQYTAELLYHVSNGTNINYREQPGTVRGANNRTPYSPLSEYQYNGDILMLLSKSMDFPLLQVLALAYKPNGRETLKNIYESMNGNQGKFDELMQNLEQIYSIDKLLISGDGQQLQSQEPLLIRMQDGTQFRGNLTTYRELMDKTERELATNFIENHDTEYVIQNYNEIAKYLTTPELKNNFLAVVKQLGQDLHTNNPQSFAQRQPEEPTITVPNVSETELPEGYEINEFGEIIRPNRQEAENPSINDNSLSFKQKVARMLQNNQLLMKIPFIKNFADKQLNALPPATQEVRQETSNSSSKKAFVHGISNNGAYRNLPQVHTMSDPERIEAMKQKMEKQQIDEDNERL